MIRSPQYQIPTHLDVKDKIDLPLFGITISLTMRQGVCFLFGGSTVFHLWQRSLGLVGILGMLVHWGGTVVLAFVIYVIAMHEFRGRHLEAWALTLVHYLSRPKVFVWCCVFENMAIPTTMEEAEGALVLQAIDWNEEEER